MAITTIWTQDGTIAEALNLPSAGADFEDVTIAAQAIKDSGVSVLVASQEGLIEAAQSLGLVADLSDFS